MTPYEAVLSHYDLPFPLYDFQVEDVNELACLNRTGAYLEPGLGKTVVSTCCALYKKLPSWGRTVDTILVIAPPLLIQQWSRWLKTIKPKNGKPLDIVSYQGSPAARKKLKLKADFVLMSIQIFKKDYQRIREELWYQRLHVVLDEAHCIKDIKTSNYKLYQEFINDTCAYPLEGHAESHRTHQLLTGTPLNKPLDAYAYIKLIAPIVYRSKGMFDQLHIAGLDSFGNPIGFKNLDLLTNSLMLSSVRHTKEDVLNLPPCTIQPIVYELDHKHKALYDKLANEQILKLGDGSKIDATQCMALFHSLQQIICQWDYFAQDPKLVSQAYRLIEETLEELGSKKLVVFANYRRTNQALVDRFKCPGVWGEVSPLQKQT
jgi:SNF2 family DNA or RNA helicase